MKPPKSESAKLNRQLSEPQAGEMLKRTWSKIAIHLDHYSVMRALPETIIIDGRLVFNIYFSVLAN